MDEVEAEVLAIQALLDDDDATEALEWLSPLNDALETPVASFEVTPLASGGDNPPPAASPITDSSQRAADEQAEPLSDTKQPHTKPSDPNRSRNERRLELIHLRRQAVELETRLGQLKRQEEGRRATAGATGDNTRPLASRLLVEDLNCAQRSEESWEENARE